WASALIRRPSPAPTAARGDREKPGASRGSAPARRMVGSDPFARSQAMSNAAAAEALFFAALDKGAAAERAAYLDSACGGDAGLRRQVEKLLRAHPRLGDFLGTPAAEQLAAASGPTDVTRELDGSTDGQGE